MATLSSPPSTVLAWQRAIAAALVKERVDVAAWVPDARLRGIVETLQDEGLPVRGLSREEECIGYAAGYGAAGEPSC